MKNRLIAYFMFLPIILLAAFTDIDIYLRYVAIASVPLSIGLLIYLFVKTRAFYKTKKVLLFILFACSLFVPTVSFAQVEVWDADNTYQEEKEKTQQYIDNLKLIYEIERIPRDQRTEDQQKQYSEAKKKLAELEKELNIIPYCQPPEELKNELLASCWACDIANIFMEAADKVATGFYKLDKEKGFSKSLLALGFFFWILVHVLKLLMSFGRGDIGAFFTDLFVKILLVGGIFILLTIPMQKVVDFFISPFFLLSSTFNQEISKISEPNNIAKSLKNVTGLSDKNRQNIEKNVNSTLSNVQCSYCQKLKSGEKSRPDRKISELVGYDASLEDRVVSPMMRNSLLCSICSIYNTTIQPTVTAQYLICNSKIRTTDLFGKKVYRHINAWIVGILLLITFFSVSAVFSFYLIDTFFRIAITLVLMPFLIVAGAFKSTFIYTKKGFEVIVHSTFTYIIIAIFLALTIQIFYYITGYSFVNIIKATYDGDFDRLEKLVGFGRSENHVVLACFAIAAIVFFVMSKLDYYITKISGINLNNSGGYQSFSTITSTAMAAKNVVSDIYSEKWKRPGNISGNSPEDKAKKIREWGQDTSDGATEKATDKVADATGKGINKAGNAAANGVDKAGTAASKGLMKGGAKLCGMGYGLGAIIGIPLMIAGAALWVTTKLAKYSIKFASWVASKVAKNTIKYGSRAVIKTAKYLNPAKIIARNKYFNKTAGLLWQGGENVSKVFARRKYKNHKGP